MSLAYLSRVLSAKPESHADSAARQSAFPVLIEAHSSHNCYYENCPFYARKGMLQVFYFCKFFGRDLAEVRGVSVEGTSQAESSGDRPGLREVVAVKALSGAGDSERERRRKIKISR